MADEPLTLNENVPSEQEQVNQVMKDKIDTFLGSSIDESPAVEPPKDEITPSVETPDPIVPPSDTPPVPVNPTPEEKPAEPIDPAKIAADAAAQAIEKIKTDFNLTQKDAESMWKWQNEKRNPKSYDEIAENVLEVVEKKMETKLEEKEAQKKLEDDKVQKQQYDIQKANEDRMNETNKIWDSQLDALQKSGKIGKTEDEVKDFWKQLIEHNKPLVESNQMPLSNLVEFYTLHYKPTIKKQVAGGDAPIAGANTDIPTNTDKTDFSHDEIRGARTLYDLVNPSK